ncbi:Hypothetical protein (Fragment) [Durusdinium trenchii]|uniref:Uncharacterized protein n=1 Tax=Durusdinium trenchii TaxID=1381693 RepID=A0ABP0IYT8_9DINO
MVEVCPRQATVRLVSTLGRRNQGREQKGSPAPGDIVLARFSDSTDCYWAKVARIAGSTCDVEWLRPFAGQPGGPLYACSNGCDDTQGRSGLRPEDLRWPLPEELASDSAPLVPEMDFHYTDVSEEEVVTVHRPDRPAQTFQHQGSGAPLWPGDIQDFHWTSMRSVDESYEKPGPWPENFAKRGAEPPAEPLMSPYY